MDLSILKKVLARCDKGEPIMDLCREYGLERHTLYSYCKRNKIILRSKYVYRPFKFSKQIRKKIANEYKNGETTPVLAKKYGINHHSILNYLREFGVNVRTIDDNRKINGQPIVNMLISSYRRSTAAKKFGFHLSYKEFEKIISNDCYYCGAKPSNNRARYDVPYNGIDRIDSNKGYTIKNVVTACFRCNTAKNNMSLLDFKNWINKLLGNDIIKKLEKLSE